MTSIQRRVFISGRVQGVGFRRSMEAYAKRFPELGGYVRNCDDGRVEAVFCGKQAEVLQMVAWCGKGPVGSKVELLEVVEESPEASMPQFEVRH